MSARPTAWLVFVAFIIVLALGTGVPDVGRALQYGLWGFWLAMMALFLLRYAREPSQADRFRLIDSRGIDLLPRAWRRWLFDDR
ncbi:exported hypothetical protein [Bradyrhizobium sp. STM 3843]|uniref:hypothetical protein n=1 Tax=Bradyrhizobium sp. STM 3843 TaxID=551947 RepID=UPI00024076FB|nr:hypothetical protein [Bradyrhizobium sp. STM 3843]CCE07151.1 exported hypothetical protein [Bradyrhizobium sp. STM 3843]